jgi:hypothetical protein
VEGKELFYNQDGIIVRRSVKKDVDLLSKNMRQSDKNEVWASHHHMPHDALSLSLEHSILCLTVEKQGEVVAMFGICPDSILGTSATIWLLASDKLEEIKKRFVRHSRKFVQMMLDFYPYLYNSVDARNIKSIEWLRFIGANIEDAKPYGVEQMPFHYFSFTKGK